MCFDNGVESEKSWAQLKEKWQALLDKYKSVCNNNNRTGRERKTFKHYEDEFMASSDKVNPKFVKETKAHKQDCSSDGTDDILSTGNQESGRKSKKRSALTWWSLSKKPSKDQRRMTRAFLKLYSNLKHVRSNNTKNLLCLFWENSRTYLLPKNRFQLSAFIPKKIRTVYMIVAKLQKSILSDLE